MVWFAGYWFFYQKSPFSNLWRPLPQDIFFPKELSKHNCDTLPFPPLPWAESWYPSTIRSTCNSWDCGDAEQNNCVHCLPDSFQSSSCVCGWCGFLALSSWLWAPHQPLAGILSSQSHCSEQMVLRPSTKFPVLTIGQQRGNCICICFLTIGLLYSVTVGRQTL